MTTETEYGCPKCGQPFPISQLHAHYNICTGPKPTIPTWPIQTSPSPTQQAPSFYIPPPTPIHVHHWIENDTFKVCPECKDIKLKIRGAWFIFTRYGLKMFWILLAVALAIAFYIVSQIHH